MAVSSRLMLASSIPVTVSPRPTGVPAARLAASWRMRRSPPYHHYWVAANKLSRGEHLKAPDGQVVTAEDGITPKVHDGWMWDLTVPGDNDHDFYVAVAATAVLVHNCPTDNVPSSEDTIHSTLRGGAGERNIESGEVIKNAESMYYDENGNQVYRLSQPGEKSQIVIRNPANGNILTNQLPTDNMDRTADPVRPLV
jgi:hypothetical protein